MAQSPGLGSYFLPMLLSAAVGAGITWLVMSQRDTSQPRPASFVTSNTAPIAPAVSGLPAADAAVVRGNQAYDHQQWAEAISAYQDAIAKGRDNADVRTDLGNAFRFSGQAEKALEQYTIAQRQNPQHENSLFNQIGLFMEIMHDPIRAIPVCEEFIRRFPTSEKIPRVKEQLAIAKNL
ncbi:MAG TPA: tetratricopeptide repeat protein [Chthoniobacterales bacterium]